MSDEAFSIRPMRDAVFSLPGRRLSVSFSASQCASNLSPKVVWIAPACINLFQRFFTASLSSSAAEPASTERRFASASKTAMSRDPPMNFFMFSTVELVMVPWSALLMAFVTLSFKREKASSKRQT